MQMMRGIFGRVGLSFALALAVISSAAAQDAFPSRPIHLIVTFPPGGSTSMSTTTSWPSGVPSGNRRRPSTRAVTAPYTCNTSLRRTRAVISTFWKRGSEVMVFVREGATFREVKLPELTAEIPEKVMAGKDYPHVVELSSQSAKRWLKDGSLEVEIETIQDGNGSTIQANRTVILGFGKDGKAKILKSTTKYTKPDEASS